MKKKVLQSFLSDAVRLSAQARECVRQLAEQAEKNRVSPAQVRSLYQIVHTLKGTASMIESAQNIVDALHDLEGILTCRPVVESAADPEWIGLAQDSVEKAHQALIELQHREKYHPKAEPEVKGLLVRATLGDDESELFWFPLQSVVRVVLPQEIQGAQTFELNGTQVPVIGTQNDSKLGLGIHSKAGLAILMIDEARKVTGWAEAQSLGAQAGLKLFTGDSSDSDQVA